MLDRPLVLGHRGASHARPENTLSAFAMARELGADGVELDARRSADGRIVVHHDPGVEGFGLIVEHGFTALRTAHPEIPTLVEALQECAGMIVNVEIKCLPWEPDADTDRVVVRAVGEIVRAAIRAGPPGSEFIVSSFDLDAVDASLAFAPEITTGWLTSGQEIAAWSRVAEPRSRLGVARLAGGDRRRPTSGASAECLEGRRAEGDRDARGGRRRRDHHRCP